jgi:hypothetical protein
MGRATIFANCRGRRRSEGDIRSNDPVRLWRPPFDARRRLERLRPDTNLKSAEARFVAVTPTSVIESAESSWITVSVPTWLVAPWTAEKPPKSSATNSIVSWPKPVPAVKLSIVCSPKSEGAGDVT